MKDFILATIQLVKWELWLAQVKSRAPRCHSPGCYAPRCHSPPAMRPVTSRPAAACLVAARVLLLPEMSVQIIVSADGEAQAYV